MRLARPVYEGLPLIYGLIGVVAIAIAYFDPVRTRSVVAFSFGLIAAIAALAIFLHRQDHRALSRDYTGETIDLPSSLGR